MKKSICEQIKEKAEIKLLLGLLAAADEDAYIHSLAVADLVEACIDEMRTSNKLCWTEEECEQIITGALLLDIGKAFLPFGLQHSSSRLNEYEKEIIDMHPILGCEALLSKHSETSPFSDIVLNIVLKHHANANGTGYPTIKKEVFNQENTPMYVWLVAYADRFTAMTRPRTFRVAKSYPDAWEEMTKEIMQERLPYEISGIFKRVISNRSIFTI